jgi:hypothetical protein
MGFKGLCFMEKKTGKKLPVKTPVKVTEKPIRGSERSGLYFSEPNKIIVSKVAGKVIIPGLENPAAWACDCICYCNCDCVAPLCDCSVCNCDCNCQTPDKAQQIINELGINEKVKKPKGLTKLDAQYGQIVAIMNSIKPKKR